MKLTLENAKIIKVGDVIRFTFPDLHTDMGVVYGHPANGDWGILCNRKDGSHFGYGKAVLNGKIDFEILEDHDPVVLVGMVYEFVGTHQ